MIKGNSSVADALTAVIKLLEPLEDDQRQRVMSSTATFFGHYVPSVSRNAPSPGSSTFGNASSTPSGRPAFSDEASLSPKEFLFQKQPKTDVERIACLAFYLTHFRNIPHFKTLDLSKLNTEAAQIKFSNANYATENAAKAGYLAAAAKGTKQITSWGEQFVTALPDRDAALKAIAAGRRRKKIGKRKK